MQRERSVDMDIIKRLTNVNGHETTT